LPAVEPVVVLPFLSVMAAVVVEPVVIDRELVFLLLPVILML